VSGTEHGFLRPMCPISVPDTNGTRIRNNVLWLHELRSTILHYISTDVRLYNIEYASETLGLRSSAIELMLLIISRCAGVFLRNTLKPGVLSLTECHSFLIPYLLTLRTKSLRRAIVGPGECCFACSRSLAEATPRNDLLLRKPEIDAADPSGRRKCRVRILELT